MNRASARANWRLFCAVELPREVRAAAFALAASWREEFARRIKASWERENKLHLTLKFFGEVDAARAAQLSQALAHAAHLIRPFTLQLAGAGVFPSPARPQILWLGVADDKGHLAALYRHLEDACARAGFPRDARPFHPHLTLARIRRPNRDARQLARAHLDLNFSPLAFPVTHITLMQSTLGAGGSTYTPLSTHDLNTTA